MTLSAFLRDYLYIPLGGNRHGNTRRYLNVIVTMLIGGLWHGAGWTFVVWGGLHGVYLAINHAFQDLIKGFSSDLQLKVKCGKGFLIPISPITRFFSFAITFLAVSIAWVFFRSPDLNTAFRILTGMMGKYSFSWNHQAHPELYWPIYIGLLAVWLLPNSQQWIGLKELPVQSKAEEKNPLPLSWQWNPLHWWNWLIPGVILAICILELTNGKPSEFLYFQF